MPRSRATPTIYVTIVSKNPETLDTLQAYFTRVGVSARCTRAAHDIAAVASEQTTATLIFPDEYDDAIILRLVAELRERRPRLLTVIVTRAPHRLRSALRSDDVRSLAPIILPKPSFGWDILDALRAHAQNPKV